MTEVLAIIPARGGSKGIPRKNIRLFAGYPLIAWSIAAAQKSTSVTRVIVSTDDEEIAAVAREWGAETPFLRPAEFAADDSRDLPAFQHALGWLKSSEKYAPEIVVQLRPTSPIRPADCVDRAVKVLLENPAADSVRGVVPAGQNPHKMWRLNGEDKPMSALLQVPGIPESFNAPRQALPPIYWQTGHIDAMRSATIGKGSMSGKNIFPLVLDARYTVDIDTPADWRRYEDVVYGGLEMVIPGRARRPLPEHVDLIVTDFDGVLTDNKVWTDENGIEMVAASRSDSMHIPELRSLGVEVVILSSEPNPVVRARAEKMGVADTIHGIDIAGKGAALRHLLAQRHVDPSRVVYIGNDLNDLPCFEVAGWCAAVADAYPEVLRAADHVLHKTGGHGALREVCELVLAGRRTK